MQEMKHMSSLANSQGNMCVHPEVSKEGDRERVDELAG